MSGIVNSVGARSGIIGSTEIPGGYEEGEWSPALQGDSNLMTMNSSYDTGYYTKVGNLVTVSGEVRTTSIGSTAGETAYIRGLPFTVADNVAAYAGAAAPNGTGFAITAGESVSYYGRPGETLISLRVWNAVTGAANMEVNEWTDDGAIVISFSYRVA